MEVIGIIWFYLFHLTEHTRTHSSTPKRTLDQLLPGSESICMTLASCQQGRDKTKHDTSSLLPPSMSLFLTPSPHLCPSLSHKVPVCWTHWPFPLLLPPWLLVLHIYLLAQDSWTLRGLTGYLPHLLVISCSGLFYIKSKCGHKTLYFGNMCETMLVPKQTQSNTLTLTGSYSYLNRASGFALPSDWSQFTTTEIDSRCWGEEVCALTEPSHPFTCRSMGRLLKWPLKHCHSLMLTTCLLVPLSRHIVSLAYLCFVFSSPRHLQEETPAWTSGVREGIDGICSMHCV